jgi:hypothetical protein
MRITSRQLRQIIREELIREAGFGDVRVAEQNDVLLAQAKSQFEEWKQNLDVKIHYRPNPNETGPDFIQERIPTPYMKMDELILGLPSLGRTFSTGPFIHIPEPNRSQLVTDMSKLPEEIMSDVDYFKKLIDSVYMRHLKELPSTELEFDGRNMNDALLDVLKPIFTGMLYSYAKIINMMIKHPDGVTNEFSVNPGPFSYEGSRSENVLMLRKLLSGEGVSPTWRNVKLTGGLNPMNMFGIGDEKQPPVTRGRPNIAVEIIMEMTRLMSSRIQTATKIKFNSALS